MMLSGAYVLSQEAFYKEVSNKTLSNLLASPMTPRTLLLGKSLAIFLFSYALELVGVTVCIIFAWFRLGELPTLASVYEALVVIPIWGFALIKLFGVIFSLVRSAVGVWLLTTPFYMVVLLTTVSPQWLPRGRHHPLLTVAASRGWIWPRGLVVRADGENQQGSDDTGGVMKTWRMLRYLSPALSRIKIMLGAIALLTLCGSFIALLPPYLSKGAELYF